MMMTLKKWLTLPCLGCFSLNIAWASSMVTGDELNQSLAFNISQTGLTRIEIQQSRIRTLNHDSPDLEVQSDEITGVIYIQPRSIQTFNLYLSTEDDLNYHLRLTPSEQESTPILIDSKVSVQTGYLELQANPYSQSLVTLMQHLARAELPPGFASIANSTPTLPADLNLLAHSLYGMQNRQLRLEVISLSNNSETTINVAPRQFQQYGVIVTALSSRSIEPGDKTRLYLIWQREGFL